MTIFDELEAIANEYIAADEQGMSGGPSGRSLIETRTTVKGFSPMSLKELLSRPEVLTDWVLDGIFAAGTVSAVVAKPKVGKSTFARGLCLAVSRGENFLGRRTKQGPCTLEERSEEVASDFRAMGANGTESIDIHADTVPEAAMNSLVSLMRKRRPILIVIDPLFRMLRVRDEKAYAEVYAALGPLIDAARSTGTHILVTHHSGKAHKGDAIDSPLGSTAIGGAVSSLVVLKFADGRRTMQTVQRIGQSVPETVLTFDMSTHLLGVGECRLEADLYQCEEEIIEYLGAVVGEKTEPEIVDRVSGATALIRKSLRSLLGKGTVTRVQTGKKGDPFKYSLVSLRSEAETRKQESINAPKTSVDIEQMLVRANGQNRMLVRGQMADEASPLLDEISGSESSNTEWV